MHPRTVATLNEIEKADWFSCVGKQDTSAAIVLSSWKEAIESCGSHDWQNLCLEAANQLRERILQRSRERFKRWNEIVDEVKPTTEALVRRKIEAVVRQHKLPLVFMHSVQWDVLHLCMEAEYADVFPPAYYASQAYWYVKGHFPCGWKGEFPKGMLIIY
jgi:tRNA/tmRNA/rRNA uracil-C5-methylase (TrmA/RlmC/RlmD family)